ncbi:AAA family ATPase [Campylobacter corcagiensis]|uniref:ATP-binding protein n=1 Tax=Campylobacter corcagiensis TaxID=1448857 RepID=A0A7M1LHC2_9BACT|nr:ATP-binding protein [Campylobacter corcagiensis]QKF63957.1 ATP-binding protein (AAA domain) [Campylobacter corcagiensis]QOQ87840.1 ATP-binding protein [Campylobacter corcagiensis]
MKYLRDFLENSVENSEIFKLLEISIDEARILKFMTTSYMDSVPANSVHSMLIALYGERDFAYLEGLESIKNLLDYGYIVRNLSIFKSEKISSKLMLLHSEVELSELFLSILEFGIIDAKFPEISAYSDHLEYLQDQFLLVELYSRRKNSRVDKKILSLKDIIAKRVALTKFSLSVEEIFKTYRLNQKEKIIFLAILKEEYSNENDDLRDLNTLISMVSDDDMDRIKSRGLLEDGSKLLSSGLIDYDEVLTGLGNITKSYFISEDMLQSIMHPKGNDKKSREIALDNIVKNSEIFELIEPKTDINDVVLNPKIKEILNSILKQLDRNVISRLNSWGIKKRKGIDAKIIFYGPPGTGKTMSAVSLAKSLKKRVLSFDCSKILSKYVGESEQNVRKIFDTYREICKESKSEPVLLLNEADQFLSSRVETSASGAEKMHNQMQNIFLEQIEQFEGVLIATTNFLEGLDRAFSRRFDFKIEFKKPDFNERVKIWQKIMPENANFEEDFSINELAKYPLTGAGIVLVLKNTALKVAVREDDIFTMDDFIEEIKREQAAAFEDDKKVGLL